MSTIDQETHLTSHEAAALLQANATSVNKWAKEGRIAHHRTPGGHRRFRLGDVLAFAEQYSMPISDARLIAVLGDRYNLTDAGRAALEVKQ